MNEHLTSEQVTAYLKPLGIHTRSPPTLAFLTKLHLARLHSIPFENLDIHLGRRIKLDLPSLYAKIVEGRHGGYCYELNGLFAALLRALEFDVSLLSARCSLRRFYQCLRLRDEFPQQPFQLLYFAVAEGTKQAFLVGYVNG